MLSTAVVSLLVILVQSQVGLGLECSSPQATDISVSVKNRRNETGHWISQIRLEHEGNSSQDNRWSVDIKQQKLQCTEKQSTRNFVITFTDPPPIAGPGYELFPGVGYYKFHPVDQNMASARAVCAEEGAHLIIVNSEREADITKTLFARYPNITNKWAWVGVIERGLNEYMTIFGESFKSTGFMRWDPTEPNGDAAGDCIVIAKIDGALHDTPCEGGFPSVCEQELW